MICDACKKNFGPEPNQPLIVGFPWVCSSCFDSADRVLERARLQRDIEAAVVRFRTAIHEVTSKRLPTISPRRDCFTSDIAEVTIKVDVEGRS